MPDDDKPAPSDPSDLAAALAFALRYLGRKRVHNADEIMTDIWPLCANSGRRRTVWRTRRIQPYATFPSGGGPPAVL